MVYTIRFLKAPYAFKPPPAREVAITAIGTSFRLASGSTGSCVSGTMCKSGVVLPGTSTTIAVFGIAKRGLLWEASVATIADAGWPTFATVPGVSWRRGASTEEGSRRRSGQAIFDGLRTNSTGAESTGEAGEGIWTRFATVPGVGRRRGASRPEGSRRRWGQGVFDGVRANSSGATSAGGGV